MHHPTNNYDKITTLFAEEMPLLALKCVHLFSSSAIALSTYFLMWSACWEVISPEALVSELSTTAMCVRGVLMVDDVWNGDGGAGGCWGRVAAITAVKHTTIHWSTNQIAHNNIPGGGLSIC